IVRSRPLRAGRLARQVLLGEGREGGANALVLDDVRAPASRLADYFLCFLCFLHLLFLCFLAAAADFLPCFFLCFLHLTGGCGQLAIVAASAGFMPWYSVDCAADS